MLAITEKRNYTHIRPASRETPGNSIVEARPADSTAGGFTVSSHAEDLTREREIGSDSI